MTISLKGYSNLLATYLAPQRYRVILLGVLMLVLIGLQLLAPQILRSFIDTAMGGGAPQSLVNSALLFLGVVVLKNVVNIGATYVSENIGWEATNVLRVDLALHCLRLDMPFHNTHTSGEMIERIDGDVQTLSNFFSQFVLAVLSNLLLIVGVLIVLFFEDWRIGLSFLVFTLLALLLLSRIRNLAAPYWQATRQAAADLYGFLEERLAGIVDIRANGAIDHAIRRLHLVLRQLYRQDLRAWLRSATLINTTIGIFVLGSTLALALSAYLINIGAITIGTAYLIYAYTLILFQPLQRITRELEKLQSASAGMVRIQELYTLRSNVQDGTAAILPPGPLSVSFQSASFGYDPSTAVLRDLAFELAPGRVLGLLGRTGSGKTSITRLLLRLYDPDSGAVKLNDIDIRTVPLANLRDRVGIVTQHAHLFTASVRDNLTFFDPQISDAQILEVLRDLELWPWFSALPEGLDTELASGGSGLSAGESQLLAFARIFLKDPGLVILDEASSRLDPNTERLIEQTVSRLLQGRTAIIIAHRLSTVQKVDQIMILEDGVISEHDERSRLVEDPESMFAQLLRNGLEETLA